MPRPSGGMRLRLKDLTSDEWNECNDVLYDILLAEGRIPEDVGEKVKPINITRYYCWVEAPVNMVFRAYRRASEPESSGSPLRAFLMKHVGRPDIHRILAALEHNVKGIHSTFPTHISQRDGGRKRGEGKSRKIYNPKFLLIPVVPPFDRVLFLYFEHETKKHVFCL